MMNLFRWSTIFFLLLFVSCNNKNNHPNITGFYECMFDGEKVALSFYEDSTYVQSAFDRTLGELQFNGKYKWVNDTIYLMDEYCITNGKTIATKDFRQKTTEADNSRILKLVKFDDGILILRDLRTQRVWEYHIKKD